MLAWTCSLPGRAFEIYRGILQPVFKAEVLAGTITGTSWTDTAALARTIQGVVPQEFYQVYAVGDSPSCCGVRATPEWLSRPRNTHQIVRTDLSNGAQWPNWPTAVAVGRDAGFLMPGSSVTQAGPWLYDAYNFPSGGGMTGLQFSALHAFTQFPATVDQSGYWAGILIIPAAGDQTAPATAMRAIPAPSVTGRNGNVVSLAWVAPVQDTPGVIAAYRVYRSTQCAGGGTLVAALPTGQESYDDDISGLVPGTWVCWSIQLQATDGRYSAYSASTAPVQR